VTAGQQRKSGVSLEHGIDEPVRGVLQLDLWFGAFELIKE